MKSNTILIVAFLFFFQLMCKPLFAQAKIVLTQEDKEHLIKELQWIAEDDQRYRGFISLGTIDTKQLEHFKRVTDTMSIEEYIAYEKTLNLELSDEVKKALWVLQHELDLMNYNKLKSIIAEYGYPGKDRIGGDNDIFPIFLHPPIQLNPEDYLIEMSRLLEPEVLAGRIPAKKYALFYDNILCKILNEPQLYGTNVPFDMNTMKPGVPIITDINKSNAARLKIGLEALENGQYELSASN